VTPHAHNPHHARRWAILGILGLAQLMVVLDATIVNIALPSAQTALAFSNENRQWIVTAYALAFGSLLLLGGRIGDLFGRKTTFIVGLIGFAVASALGGAAQSFGVLVAARALQGVFGALLAPAALSLLTTTFTDPKERNTAIGVFGAIAGSGAAVGLLLGGVLTEYLSWRWCLYVNLVFAAVAAVGAWRLLHNQVPADKPRLDIPGTLTASAGLFGLVYGFSHAESAGWGAPLTLVALGAAAVLLSAFVALQRRVAHPLLPLHVVLDRTRGGSYLALALAGAGIFGVFLFLTYYLQQNLGFSPIRTGLAFLPMTLSIMVTATYATTRLVPRVGPRPMVVGGLALATAGMLYLAQLSVDSHYATGVLPALLLLGPGLGLIFATCIDNATAGVAPHDAGVASAMVNTMQQVGGSVGTELMSSYSAGASSG
jgi:EmrB/QacA subfamily drug resistance transporter